MAETHHALSLDNCNQFTTEKTITKFIFNN